MDLDKLKALAGGKVYTGRVAKRLGLVDELGDLKDAVQLAKTMGGLGPDDKIGVKVLPKPENPFELLLGGSRDAEREARTALPAVVQLAPELKPLLRHAWVLKQMLNEPGALVMPYWIEIR